MSRVKTEVTLYKRLKRDLETHTDISAIISTGEYAPIHKSPGILPYDAVIVFKSGDWDEESVKQFLDTRGIEYHAITGVTNNSRTRYEGTHAAFIALTDTKLR